jgi:Fe-S oxidoreductase
MAERWWIDLLGNLRPWYDQSIPMVVLEPSCWAAFKDELCNLFPHRQDAKKLAGLTFTLSDFLRDHAPDYAIPKLHRKALVHGHCHQKSLDTLNDKEFGKLFAEKQLFKAMGLDDHHPETGCCGMAGAFGYENDEAHYQVSIGAGERELLPDVRQAADEELIIADGFSCQEQIRQQTDRQALHTAQVLQLALHNKGHSPQAEGRPEAAMVRARNQAKRKGMVRAASLLVAGAGAVGVGLYLMNRQASKPSCQLPGK